jgi:hypothetical protein
MTSVGSSQVGTLLLQRACATLRRLQQTRGRSVRTARRIGQVAAAVLVAFELLHVPAAAAAPRFVGPSGDTNPFGLAAPDLVSAPALVDIDGDGDLDAFIGDQQGNLQFFRNSGRPAAARFDAPQSNPFGLTSVGADATPAFADIDADGDLDAFVGEHDGHLTFFRNDGGRRQPRFSAGQRNPFGLSVDTYAPAPTFADIDGDGDLDALIGAQYGDTLFFANIGTRKQPSFTGPGKNVFGLTGLPYGYAIVPALADIDGDGDLDAFLGDTYGATRFFLNFGSARAPAFTELGDNPFGLGMTGDATAPAFADIDGDGDLDAFFGNGYDQSVPFLLNRGSRTMPSFASLKDNPFGIVTELGGGSPAFVDIDADGDRDAFVSRGRTVSFFRNDGSARAPRFAAPLEDPFGLGTDEPYAERDGLTFADIDGDGDLDAFFGTYHGDTFWLQNQGTRKAPAFVAAQTNPFGLVAIEGTWAIPSLADLDGDGDLDLCVGKSDGFAVFMNRGSTSAPAFEAPLTNPFGLSDMPRFAKPSFVDLDGDGDLDLLAGSDYGNLYYLANRGSRTNAQFGDAQINPFGLRWSGYAGIPTWVDIDGDGDSDLFVGSSKHVTFFLNSGEAPRCAGDCDADGAVGINEIITGVNIALGAVDDDSCAPLDTSGDGRVGIDELIAAVGAALNGCPAAASK